MLAFRNISRLLLSYAAQSIRAHSVDTTRHMYSDSNLSLGKLLSLRCFYGVKDAEQVSILRSLSSSRTKPVFFKAPIQHRSIALGNLHSSSLSTVSVPRNLIHSRLLSTHSSARFSNNSQGDSNRNEKNEKQEQNGGSRFTKGLRRYIVPALVLFGIFHIIGYVMKWVKTDAWSETTRENSSVYEGDLRHGGRKISVNEAIIEARKILSQFKMERLCPGLTVTVSVDGNIVWTEGMGLSDVENDVACTPRSIMRIASISKPLTMTVVAKLWQDGKLDLDAPIQKYVKDWPDKYYEGKKVDITTRQLVSMLGGIRHYDKDCGKKKKESQDKDKDKDKDVDYGNKRERDREGEFSYKEYYIQRHYDSVSEALEIFKQDQLCSLPGTTYLYSSHCWTLISAVVEGASGKKFEDLMLHLFNDLGMTHTYLEYNQPIIYGRSRYYKLDKQKKGRLLNAPYVDNSYKWAGGGFLSTPTDLVRFGNAMLYSFQQPPSGGPGPRGYLKPETVREIWRPVEKTRKKVPSASLASATVDGEVFYGMGWGTIPAASLPAYGREQRMYVSHTGGAVGGSSVLMILPPRGGGVSENSIQGVKESNVGNSSVGTSNVTKQGTECIQQATVGSAEKVGSADVAPLRGCGGLGDCKGGVKGVVVSIIVNLQGVGMNGLALEIASLFDRVR